MQIWTSLEKNIILQEKQIGFKLFNGDIEMIEIKNVSESYVKGEKVIDNMNLKIEDGTVFGFIGPNGAGKTTTIEMITGVLNIDEGDILIDGKSIKKNPIEAKKLVISTIF